MDPYLIVLLFLLLGFGLVGCIVGVELYLLERSRQDVFLE